MKDLVRRLLDEHLKKLLSQEDLSEELFSEDFSGLTAGASAIVRDRNSWTHAAREDLSQAVGPIRIEVKDIATQPFGDSAAAATAILALHLPETVYVHSVKTARVVAFFRREADGWKISHASFSLPRSLVEKGEVPPFKEPPKADLILDEHFKKQAGEWEEETRGLRARIKELERELGETKRTTQALLESERRYRSIVDAAPDNIAITDRDGRILIASPNARALFGRTREAEFEGSTIADYLVPEDRERALKQIALKRKGVKTGPGEYRGLTRSGAAFDMEVTSEFIRNEQGHPEGMVLIVRDITDRKREQAEKEKLERQKRHLQKAESLGRMAGAIAHNFNNQLQAVTMGLEMALFDLPEKSGATESVAISLQSARKASEMSSLMLTYLGHSVAKRKPLELAEACRRDLAILQPAIPKRVYVESALPKPGPWVQADPNQIRQIFLNLVTNAWEALGPHGTTVAVSVKTVEADELPQGRHVPFDIEPLKEPHACLEVRDTGVGIEEKDLEAIFEPFFSRKASGRGMGLAVVLGLARALDGFITVESHLGKGSTFRVYLPLLAPPEAP